MIILIAIAGLLCTQLILGRSDKWLHGALALPLGALLNALLTFAFTLAHIPLNLWTYGIGYIVLLGVMIIICRGKLLHCSITTLFASESQDADSKQTNSVTMKQWNNASQKLLIVVCAALLVVSIIYSFSHAVLLPTFQYDSATNWTMRSQISFYDQSIAFDETEERGMAKPQYPILFHALQIAANQGFSRWNDSMANFVLYILSLCTFASIALLLARLRGWTVSLITVTLIIGIPLLGVQLAQGYGDNVLVQYVLLSMICLCMWINRTKMEDGRHKTEENTVSLISSFLHLHRWLILSGLFAVAATWTKSEGFFVATLPLLGLMIFYTWIQKRHWKPTIAIASSTLILSALWYVLLIAKGLNLTPHGSDAHFSWHADALREMWPALFSRGSFGIVWYVLPVALIALGIGACKKNRHVHRLLLSMALWSFLIFGITLFTYLFTPNAQFLLNAESFYRQMVTPAALLILTCAVSLRLPTRDVR